MKHTIAALLLTLSAGAFAQEIQINHEGFAELSSKLDGVDFSHTQDLAKAEEAQVSWTCDDTYMNAKGIDLLVEEAAENLSAYASTAPGSLIPSKTCRIESIKKVSASQTLIRVKGDSGCAATVVRKYVSPTKKSLINVFLLQDEAC